jgi:hypothetical protein
MKVWVWKKSNKNECKRCSSSNWGGRVSPSLRVICFRERGIRYHQIWLSCFYPLQALRRAFCRPVPARTIENFLSQFRVRTYPFAPPLGGSLPLSESFALIAQSGSYLTFTDNFMDQALARDIFDYVSAGSILPACLPASATSSELEPCKARLKLAKVQTAGRKSPSSIIPIFCWSLAKWRRSAHIAKKNEKRNQRNNWEHAWLCTY